MSTRRRTSCLLSYSSASHPYARNTCLWANASKSFRVLAIEEDLWKQYRGASDAADTPLYTKCFGPRSSALPLRPIGPSHARRKPKRLQECARSMRLPQPAGNIPHTQGQCGGHAARTVHGLVSRSPWPRSAQQSQPVYIQA